MVNGHIVCPHLKSLRTLVMRQTSLRYGLNIVAILAVLMPARGLWGQARDTTLHCDGLTVDSVEVQTNRPAFTGAMAWWRKLARSVGLHHQTTERGLVRRFVSLDVGKGCTEFRRSESQRILRAQPYIADATVTTTRVGDSARVDVSTVDEVSAVGGVRLSGASLRALSLGTLNFRGAGMHLEGRWESGRAFRDGFGAKLVHHQLLGKPYTLALEGARHPIGEYSSAELSHRFLTDLQRIAWHAGYLTSKDYAHLRRPDRVELVQPVDRWMWNVGGVVRLGQARRLWLLGGMVLGERLVPQHQFSTIDSTTGGLLPPTTTDTAGVRKYPSYDATNVAGVFGIRALTFSRMRGLDALAAEQDIGTGTQIGAMLGLRPFFYAPLQDAFASIDAYFAGRTRRSFAGARMEAESRVDVERKSWQHLIASGRAAWYFKPTGRWVSELSLEAAAGWRTILPFQLELGDRQSGVRGYAQSREPGAQRVIARVEQRVDLRRFRVTRAAIGAVVFTDAGRTWGGDVPFGIDTPLRTSVGAGILAAVPANSQRTIRAELALPLSRGTGARPEVRFTVREPARGFWYEPRRIRWARLSAVPEQIFSWP